MLKYQLKLRSSFILLLFMSFILSGCATTAQTTMTPKQQATVWMEIYNAQYDDTMRIMYNPNATDAQKEIGRKKKEILKVVWPLLKDYIFIVDSKGTPSMALELEILEQINQLTMLAGGS
jgi:hypothetical protein